ncbi:MAG: hypothetical protein ACRDZ8_07725 [Acidimicrobiales bacterium]
MTEYDESSAAPEPAAQTPVPVGAAPQAEPPTNVPAPAAEAPESDPAPGPHEHQGHLAGHLLERLRGTGVGMSDPNIIGDAGATDVAPGHDPELGETDDVLPPEEETPSERELPSLEE